MGSRTVTIPESIINKMKKTASFKTWAENGGEDFVVYDFSGSNVDDAYEGGERAGNILATREFLDLLGIEYTIED